MFKFITHIKLLTLCLVVFSCTRSFENKSNVTLSFANLNQVGSMTCTTCLKSIIIKVEGNGFDKILTKLSSDNIRDTSEISASDFTFNLPPGTDRKFKVVAIYILNEKHILAYGESSIDLPDTTPKTVEIKMDNKGEIHGGSLVGRYITNNILSHDVGPTGSVDMILNYNSDPDFDMFIAKSQILNGWFDFMASENLEMTYKISSSNEILFEKKSLNTIVPLNGSASENHLGRIVRPEQYFRYNGSSWNEEDEKHDIVYGYFGEPSYLSNKYICFEYASTPVSLTKMSSISSGASPLTYSHNNDPAANVYGIGGMSSNTSECTLSYTESRFAENKISINSDQLNGNGNDTAKGFGNAFSYISTYISPAYSVQKYYYNNGVFSLKTLPGLFGPTNDYLFNNIKLYKKANATNGGFDDLQCTQEWLDDKGFSPMVANTSLSADITTFQITGSISSSDGTIACPTKMVDGLQTLQTHGGFYLGGLEYSHLTAPSAHIVTPSPGYIYVNITNTGTKTATSIMGTLPGGTIVFFNGSFSAAGNCMSSLAPGATCQVKLTATSVDSTNLMINFDAGVLIIPVTSGP